MMKLLCAALTLVLSVSHLFSCACSNKPAAPPPKMVGGNTITLPGTEWVLNDLAGTPALSGGKATLAFAEGGRVAGNGSCNRFTGSAVITGDTLKLGPLASTRMACADNDVSKQEDTYLKALLKIE